MRWIFTLGRVTLAAIAILCCSTPTKTPESSSTQGTASTVSVEAESEQAKQPQESSRLRVRTNNLRGKTEIIDFTESHIWRCM